MCISWCAHEIKYFIINFNADYDQVLWDVASHQLLKSYRCFGEVYSPQGVLPEEELYLKKILAVQMLGYFTFWLITGGKPY
jgi:hypothetical protein